MKIEKFDNYYNYISLSEGISKDDLKETWEHQQTKIDNILEYISLIGHQKELDRFLKNSKESI